MKPEIYKADSKKFDLTFLCRPGTSDIKSVREVVEKNEYQRKDFTIEVGENWLDIGAYIGAFSCVVLARQANVIAFEPFEPSRILLEENIKLNGFVSNFQVKPVALVADSGGQREMGINRNGNLWRNSIVKTPAQRGSVMVDCEPIENFLWMADCVKMDVEGSEMELLKDVSIYRNLKKLVFEWGFDVDPSLELFRSKCEELKKIFKHVKHANFSAEETVHHWFPPCTKVFCWNE